MKKLLFLAFLLALLTSCEAQNSVIGKNVVSAGRVKLTSDGKFTDTTYAGWNFYAHGDTLIEDTPYGKMKIYMKNPGNFQALGYDSVAKLWRPVTISGGGGGGGGPIPLNTLLNPTGTSSFTMGGYTIGYTFTSDAGTNKFKITDNSQGDIAPIFEIVGSQVYLGVGQFPIIFKSGRGTNYISQTWNGTNVVLSATGTNSQLWATHLRGNYPLVKADLPTTVVYNDQSNTITANIIQSANFAGTLFDATNSNNSGSSKVFSASILAGDAYYGITTAGNGMHGQTQLGRGVWGHSTNSGTGVYASSSNFGSAFIAEMNGTTVTTINTYGITNNALMQMNSGNKIVLNNNSNTTSYALQNTGTTLDLITDPYVNNIKRASVTASGFAVDNLQSMSASGINVADNLNPNITNTYDLGSASRIWRSAYIDKEYAGPNTIVIVRLRTPGDSATVPFTCKFADPQWNDERGRGSLGFLVRGSYTKIFSNAVQDYVSVAVAVKFTF
jgi:hypothetical protein